MKWEYIFTSVVILYAKAFAIFIAYSASKFFTAQSRTSKNPPKNEKWKLYAICIVAVFLISLFASVVIERDDDDDAITNATTDYNRGAIVFLVLIIPALIGAAEGFTSDDDRHVSSSQFDDD